MRRRILEKIQLTKIAAVDRPAQEHALVTIMKRRPKKQQVDDPDDDNIEDDWSVNAPRKKKPKGWSRDDIDAVNKRKPPEHPLLRRARALSQKHGVPMYLGLAAARREDPQSYRHFQQQGIAASQPKPIKKAVPDADVVAWDAAVNTWATNYGISRCEAMTEIRKRAPALWARYRRQR